MQSLTTRLMKTAGQGTQRLAFTASSVQERVAAANWILMCQQKEVASRVTHWKPRRTFRSSGVPERDATAKGLVTW